MHAKTQDLLNGCRDASHVCPKKIGVPMEAYMAAVATGLGEVHALRLKYALMTGQEDVASSRGRMAELDQKLGAAEREGRKLMDQAIKFQDILRQFREAETRISAELDAAPEEGNSP